MARPSTKGSSHPGLISVNTFHGSEAPIAWSGDGEIIATAGKGGGFIVWNADTAEIRSRGGDGIRFRAFSLHGDQLAAIGQRSITIWNIDSGKRLYRLNVSDDTNAIAWSPDGTHIATSAHDGTLQLWDPNPLRKQVTMRLADFAGPGNGDILLSISWSNDSQHVAGASYSTWIFDIKTKKAAQLETHGGVYDVAWSQRVGSNLLAAATSHNNVEIWNPTTEQTLTVLEGHTDHVKAVSFSTDGRYLASAGADGLVILWRCRGWVPLAHIRSSATSGLAFRPRRHQLAFPAPASGFVQLWRLDDEQLRGQAKRTSIVAYKSAKIVLVGDSGVGKTGLGWRIAHSQFKEHSSTHGQQFWVVNQLSARRRGSQREAVLWDLAGQPDYRLIHALFVDDADIALLLFDPTHPTSPLHGVEFWVKQLRLCHSDGNATGGTTSPLAALVAARTDRGTPRLTREELGEFAMRSGLAGPFYTSALSGEGVDDIIDWLSKSIPWDSKPETITTKSFKKIKDLSLIIKQNRRKGERVILALSDLKKKLDSRGRSSFDITEIEAAVGHLATHGYVSLLRTSKSEIKILLLPELLNNLAASFVLEARKNRKGLGSLKEQDLVDGKYEFSELSHLSAADRETMIDSTAAMFLKHNICFRESDPLNNQSYLIFPELINLNRPAIENGNANDDVSYVVTGAIENVYSSLVVLLGYTNTFTRTNQWRNQARYEVGEGLVCGFKLEQEEEAELTFVLYFGDLVGGSVRTLFRSLFETFLSRHEVVVRRFEPAICSSGHQLNRLVVRELASAGEKAAFCSRCGEKIALPDAAAPITLTAPQADTVRDQSRVAEIRSRFEEALFRLSTFAKERNQAPPSCFISYAWGDPVHERWVERSLATDLLKAGVQVILDRWENARIGSSIPRFVELIGHADCVVVVGTPAYKTKYGNTDPDRSYIVAAEGDLIGRLMIGSEEDKRRVLPALLSGTDKTSFPDILRGRTYSDFRNVGQYFSNALVLTLSLYGVDPTTALSKEIRALVEDTFSQ